MDFPATYIPVWVLLIAVAAWLLHKWLVARDAREDAAIKAQFEASEAALARKRLEDAYEDGRRDAQRKAESAWASHILEQARKAHSTPSEASIALYGREGRFLGEASASDIQDAPNHMEANGTIARMLDDPSRVGELADALRKGYVPAGHPMGHALGQALILQLAQNKGVLDEVGDRRGQNDPIISVAERMRRDAGIAPSE